MALSRIFLWIFLFTALTVFSAACSSDNDSELLPDGDENESALDGDAESDIDQENKPDGDEDIEAMENDDLEHESDTAEQEEEIVYGEGLPPRPDFAPSLIARPEDKERLLKRIEEEPFDYILEQVRNMAARGHYDFPEPDTFDSDEQVNGETALAAAFLAWLLDDEDMALKARDFFIKLSDNYDSHEDFDIDIRMPSIAMSYAFALDLLIGADRIPEAEAEEMEQKLTTIIGAFYEDYILNEFNRLLSIHYTQNNHPIRTACSIAAVAMAFPDHPDAPAWANWAFSELDYLWGEDGVYVQPDGGVCEGSLYYRFAFAPTLALSLAWENRVGEPRIFSRDCINRLDEEPWNSFDCVDGEPFVYVNLLQEELFRKTEDWFLTLRMPDGNRPPFEDSGMRRDNGGAIMAGFLNRPDMLWDWYNDEQNMGGGMDLNIQHLLWLPDDMQPQEPDWRNRVMYDAGHAVFRSGWGPEDLWVFVTAEHGPARLGVHDHVDGGSFTMSAYGEYLLMDTGYYKPNVMDNARTAQAASHNLLMIDGEPVPPKGLILNFGDADAFLKNEQLLDGLDYVEAWQDIDKSRTERAVVLIRDRYLVVFDRVVTSVTEPRLHTWRLHGFAGYGEGGIFAIDGAKTNWERTLAGIDVYLASTDTGLQIVEPEYKEGYAPHVHEVVSDTNHHGVADGLVTGVAPRFAAVAAPYKTGAAEGSPESPLEVVQVMGIDGVAAWIVTFGDRQDIVMARAPDASGTIEFNGGYTIVTDGEWIIATLSGGEPLYLMARGSMLSVNGTSIFEGITTDVAARGLEQKK